MINTISYKGYTARVQYSPDDDVFVGRILGIEDSISFHGTTVKELHADLKAAIDHYLEDCRKAGRKPKKQASGNLMVRIAPELHAAAALAAQAQGKSLNIWVEEAIREHASV
ncbi:MAG: type II toxin-antitoxin system HicB family antitoxin [Thermodesulfovibrionales bacterium]